MREDIINALLFKGVEAIKNEELLTATDEEIKHCLSKLDSSQHKTRCMYLKRELNIRNIPITETYKTPGEKKKFAQKWNKVTSLFK